MEQHPIPQQISSYQFRLVGDMTLKQFFQVAGGVVVSLLIYSTGLHPFIKWPLIIFSGSLGAAMAFLPFQERPLENWILAFFRSVYSPTYYYWARSQIEPTYYQPEATPSLPQQSIASATTVSLPFAAGLEDAEKSFLSKLSTLFSMQPSVQTVSPSTGEIQTPIAPSHPAEVVVPVATPQTVAPQQPTQPKIVVEERTAPVSLSESNVAAANVGQTLTGQATAGAQAAQFSAQAAPPNPPEHPNIVVGQVMDSTGKIVEGAILEIKDDQGRPVRALKSNKAGHFFIVTPLLNGKYELVAEKEGYEFDSVTFETAGNILAPIAVRSKKETVPLPS